MDPSQRFDSARWPVFALVVAAGTCGADDEDSAYMPSSQFLPLLTVSFSSAETNCQQWEELRRWHISRVFVICTASASCHNKGKDRPSSAIKALRWVHSRESRRRRDGFGYSM